MIHWTSHHRIYPGFCLSDSRDVSPFKVFVRKTRVCSDAFLNAHAEPAEHDRDRSAGRGITNHLKCFQAWAGSPSLPFSWAAGGSSAGRDRAPHHRQGRAGRNRFRQAVDVRLMSLSPPSRAWPVTKYNCIEEFKGNKTLKHKVTDNISRWARAGTPCWAVHEGSNKGLLLANPYRYRCANGLRDRFINPDLG